MSPQSNWFGSPLVGSLNTTGNGMIRVPTSGVSSASWAVAAGSSALAGANPADRVHVTDASDARAIEIAQSVMATMGGWESWDATRYLSWHFFGGRVHHWDRYTGDELPEEERIDNDEYFTIRSWMAVMSYMLSDYRFLYE